MIRKDPDKLANALEKAGWEIVEIKTAMIRELIQGGVSEQRLGGGALDIQIKP